MKRICEEARTLIITAIPVVTVGADACCNISACLTRHSQRNIQSVSLRKVVGTPDNTKEGGRWMRLWHLVSLLKTTR